MNTINKFMWAGALALGLAGFASSASAGVDVYVGVGTPGVVYYDDARPVYRDHYYSAPRPVYHYYDRRPAHRHYDRRPVYNNYYYYRDNGNHRHYRDHGHHHDHGPRGHDRRWRDDHDRRHGRR